MTIRTEERAVSTENAPGNRLLLAGGGAFSLTLSIALAAAGLWLVPESHERYANWVTSGAPVIIMDNGITIFYGIPLLLLCLFLLGCYGLAIGIKGERNQWVDRHLIKPLNIGIIVGALLMFAGKYVGNKLWSSELINEGYVHCDDSFVLTGTWATDVWALSPTICMDPELKAALRQPNGSVYNINSYYSPLPKH